MSCYCTGGPGGPLADLLDRAIRSGHASCVATLEPYVADTTHAARRSIQVDNLQILAMLLPKADLVRTTLEALRREKALALQLCLRAYKKQPGPPTEQVLECALATGKTHLFELVWSVPQLRPQAPPLRAAAKGGKPALEWTQARYGTDDLADPALLDLAPDAETVVYLARLGCAPPRPKDATCRSEGATCRSEGATCRSEGATCRSETAPSRSESATSSPEGALVLALQQGNIAKARAIQNLYRGVWSERAAYALGWGDEQGAELAAQVPAKYARAAAAGAAQGGNLACLRRLLEVHPQVLSPQLMSLAASRGQLGCLEYLAKRRCPADDSLLYSSLACGEEAFAGALQYRYPSDPQAILVAAACRGSGQHVAHLLRRVRYRPEELSVALAVAEDRVAFCPGTDASALAVLGGAAPHNPPETP